MSINVNKIVKNKIIASSNKDQNIKKESQKSHIDAVHNGVKNYMCSICQKAFGFKSNLLLHVKRVHENVKPFQCAMCQKSFSINHDLKKHVEAAHEVNNIQCSFCTKTFNREGSLKHHIASLHPQL